MHTKEERLSICPPFSPAYYAIKHDCAPDCGCCGVCRDVDEKKKLREVLIPLLDHVLEIIDIEKNAKRPQELVWAASVSKQDVITRLSYVLECLKEMRHDSWSDMRAGLWAAIETDIKSLKE